MNINTEPLKLFRPVISGLIMNSYYSLLNLKHASGIELTEAEKKTTMDEVYAMFGDIDKRLQTCFVSE